jgi:hypothetical protein
MSVTKVTVSHEGWTGSADIREGRKYTVNYIVECNDPEDGSATILDSALMPTVGAAYDVGNDRDFKAALKTLTVSPIAGTRNLWSATGTFEPIKPEQPADESSPEKGKNEKGEPDPDPLNWAAMLSWSTVRVTRPAQWGAYMGTRRYNRDMNQNVRIPLHKASMDFANQIPAVQNWTQADPFGIVINGVPITNSVFKPFDPAPEIEYSRLNLRYTFSSDHFPERFMRWVNCINRHAFTIRHAINAKDEQGNNKDLETAFFVPEYSMKILGVSSQIKVANDIGYHEVVVETEIDSLFGYRLNILDRGYSKRYPAHDADDPAYSNPFGSKPLVDADGQRETEPSLLDGRGNRLDLRKNAGVYIEYGVYPEKAFTALKFHLPNEMRKIKPNPQPKGN